MGERTRLLARELPGSIDASGTFELSGVEGGSTRLVAHVGIATAQATVRVRVVLVENPGHLESDVIAKLAAPRETHAP